MRKRTISVHKVDFDTVFSLETTEKKRNGTYETVTTQISPLIEIPTPVTILLVGYDASGKMISADVKEIESANPAPTKMIATGTEGRFRVYMLDSLTKIPLCPSSTLP